MPSEVWDEITNPFLNSTVVPLRFMNGYVISSNTLPGMQLLIHAGIKVKPC